LSFQENPQRARRLCGYSTHQDARRAWWPPYKGDFFRLFVAASDAGLMKQSAPKSLKLDSLISIISARDRVVFDGETWRMFSAAWPEWDYAWSHAQRRAPLDDDLPGG
jgi:hypothetical protein